MDAVPPQPTLKAARKLFRQSGLRKSINFNDDDDSTASSVAEAPKDNTSHDVRPVVIRPTIGRSGSTKQKRQSSSRLSFGGTELPSAGRNEGDDGAILTPKKPVLAQRALENNAFRKSTTTSRLPTRPFGDDDDRPNYSKEYLDELQSSTPNTPQNLSALHITDDDPMDLDPSELEGALIVNEDEFQNNTVPEILSETQIREKKERRARLAREQDFISLNDDDNRPRSKKDETRLVREDEDLGEGFDEFVEDGGLSLGKKAAKEARRRQRKEMEEMILHAEGSSEDESEVERMAAFEAAQTRAGMDGLERPRQEPVKKARKPLQPTTIPNLAQALQDLDVTISDTQQMVAGASEQVESLRAERDEIASRDLDNLRASVKTAEENFATKLRRFEELKSGVFAGARAMNGQGLSHDEHDEQVDMEHLA
jgi:hypothetical protein